jgi:hypothetical protein
MLTPHAYVVEYRVTDACFPPDCTIDGQRTFGRAFGGPPGSSPGSYVAVGTDKNELFAKRGLVLGPAKELSFTLSARNQGSVLDMSLATADVAGGPFRAVLEVRAGSAVLARRAFDGVTASFKPESDPAELGREERYFTHVRESLPATTERTTITLRNEGTTPLGVGAPLVLRRVEGRGPRQVFLVFFDAVPYPIFEQLYETGDDPSSRWISTWVGKGTLFSQAISPGQLTGSFVRRFFWGEYFGQEGDPSLAGQGFDDAPPQRAPGPVARMAEQGFITEAIGSNLYLSPILSRIGFDSDYNIESTLELQIHPHVLAERFAKEIEIHGEDDALFVIWYANTHVPWLEGRRDAPPLRETGIAKQDLDTTVLESIWRNLFDAVDSLRKITDDARRRNASAERVWILGADHGHTFTLAARARPWRLTRETVEQGHMHCCLATQQEARTPLLLIAENGAPSAVPGKIVDEPMSALAAWREIERRFGVKLDLPRTSAFALPTDEPGFDDGIFVSVGNSGSLFGRFGELSYHSYQPAMGLSPVWAVTPKVALLLKGTSEPAGDVVAEELYDLARDPGERDNLADRRFGDLVEMRKKMADFLAEYSDSPEHERYEYDLTFSRLTEIAISAPRGFSLSSDHEDARHYDAKASAKGTLIRLRDGERPLGVVDLSGDVIDDKLVIRCGSSGLPLANLDADHPRLNLALARTNCVSGGGIDLPKPAPGEALFRAELVQKKQMSGAPAVAPLPELTNALRRWGYVRDK